MRAVFWREFRELALLWVPLSIVAVLVAAEMPSPGPKTDDILGTALLCGLAVGVVHGILDRLRRDDDFLRHRPVSRLRLNGARTLAGLAACAIPTAAFLIWFPVFTEMQEEPWRRLGGLRMWRLDAATIQLVLAAVPAAWAAIRLAVGTRNLLAALVLLLAVPYSAWSIASRAGTVGSACAVLVVLAAACTVLRVASGARMRAAVVLLLLAPIGLEGLLYLRTATTGLQLDHYPAAALDEDGDLFFYEEFFGENAAGRYDRRRFYDAERKLLGTQVLQGRTQPYPCAARLWPFPAREVWDHLDRPAFIRSLRDRPPHWVGALSRALSDWSRGTGRYWMFENGRFVAREPVPRSFLPRWGNVAAGLGPDGYREGSGAAEGPAFDEEAVHFYQDYTERKPTELAFLSPDATRITVVRFGESDVRVETRPFLREGPAEILAVPGHYAVLARGQELIVLDRAGTVLERLSWEPDREILFRSGPLRRVGFASYLSPVHPSGGRLRLRLLREDAPAAVAEVDLRPETFVEHLIASLGGIAAITRPLPLNAGAWLSAAPRTWSDLYAWWWRDPWFGGGAQTGWLLFSLVAAVLCGLYAYRQGRVRCATVRGARFWAAACFLLGPLGLFWMRLVLPPVPVEPVGGARRAVNLDRCPATDAPWPEPEPSGVEVIAR